jgi:hypothetical protein
MIFAIILNSRCEKRIKIKLLYVADPTTVSKTHCSSLCSAEARTCSRNQLLEMALPSLQQVPTVSNVWNLRSLAVWKSCTGLRTLLCPSKQAFSHHPLPVSQLEIWPLMAALVCCRWAVRYRVTHPLRG